MAKFKEGPGTEFPQGVDQYVASLEREALGYQRRLQEIEGVPDNELAVAEAKSGLEAVKAELRRFSPGPKPTQKRPAKKETTKKRAVKK
jgi:hypothetical protein